MRPLRVRDQVFMDEFSGLFLGLGALGWGLRITRMIFKDDFLSWALGGSWLGNRNGHD